MILNPDKYSFMLFGVEDEFQTTVTDWCSMGLVVT